MKVREIMTRDLTSVDPDTTVRELIYILDKSGLSSVPAVDEDGRVLGIVSERDIIEGAVPGYFELLHGSSFLPAVDQFSEKLKEIENDPVSLYMTRNATKIDEDDDDLAVADLMLHKNLKMLPVVNKDGLLVGMLRRIDLLKDLL
ncbi:CBS domain-containing protein [Candidatus Acetothermia bacterium]|nr:CBS domain-containing protein [Candidatus Acetothermia bacterium]MBI3460909.1 CBS domain-containing protein [Candidatus Acetothermia bacterium]MBI3661154.1 CBS domain-containing protein [Candidatus Acetothermia bacterium]